MEFLLGFFLKSRKSRQRWCLRTPFFVCVINARVLIFKCINPNLQNRDHGVTSAVRQQLTGSWCCSGHQEMMVAEQHAGHVRVAQIPSLKGIAC